MVSLLSLLSKNAGERAPSMANPLKTLRQAAGVWDEVSPSRHQLSKIGGDGRGERANPRTVTFPILDKSALLYFVNESSGGKP